MSDVKDIYEQIKVELEKVLSEQLIEPMQIVDLGNDEYTITIKPKASPQYIKLQATLCNP